MTRRLAHAVAIRYVSLGLAMLPLVLLAPRFAAAQGTTSVSSGSPTTADSAKDSTTAKPAPKAPPKPKVFDFTGSLGFAQTRGNATARNINVGNTIRYRLGEWTIRQDLSFIYGESNGRVNANFWNGGLRFDRNVADRIEFFLASRYDRNVPQGVTSRFQQGFGLNVVAFEDSRNRVQVSLGGSLFSQQLEPGAVARVSRAFPAARAALDYRYRFSQLAYLRQTAEYLPAIGDTATSVFVNTESAIVAPISRNVGVKIGYVVRYNSEPPIRNDVPLRTTDMFFSSGLTLTF
ncbi:MAG TPA: DUF481 domain-containing protein [Gemmatimonas sp.]|uniref:DUF481 domain-containing protein n=1 Tax=Gemmatimonas sp. TaxID=1962908 RepID=UPI002ED8345B